MEFRHLTYFLVLSEELHFRRAAEKLFIAQPALTKQIKELEASLGVILFKRDKRNVSLTPAGTFLQREGYKLIKHRDMIQSSVAEIGNTLSGTITLGCIGSAMMAVVPELIQKIDAELPGIRTQLIEDTTQNLLNALLDGRIDIMFTRPIKQLPHISSMVIHQESTVVAVAKNSRWAINQHSSLAALAHVPFLLFPRSAGVAFRDQIVRACSKYQFAPYIKHESIHAPFLLRLVEKDLGVAILPYSIAQSYHYAVDYWDLQDIRIPVDLVVSYRSDNYEGLVKHILAMIKTDARS